MSGRDSFLNMDMVISSEIVVDGYFLG